MATIGLTIGQKPNLLELQNRLLRQLTSSEETLTTEQEVKDALREALEGWPALIVVDDAWTIDHADAFSVTAPPACLLMTTRNNEVLVGLGAEEHRVDVLLPDDALKMLAEWVGQKSPDKLPPEAAEVAKECGYLPLALAMIGAMIRLRPTAWKDALGRLRRADLGAIKRAFPGYPYPDLLRAIEVSVEELESADRERYLDLAVFPEDQPIPEEALGVLWNLDDVDTRDCMTRLVARSLATRSEAGGPEALILHDLQRDLIYKRRKKDLPGLHLRLVEDWDALPKIPDAYAWRWMPYHLVRAGRKDDLHRLLLDFNYLQAKLAATDANALIADYDYWPEDKDLQLVQAALRLSANILVRDQRQFASQLTGRLLGIDDNDIQALLKLTAEKALGPSLWPLRGNLTPPGGPLIRILEDHSSYVNGVAITPDGRRAVSASCDNTLRVWDLESRQSLRTLEGHSSFVRGVAITPDGRRVVSASRDNTLRVWELEDGESLRTPEGHSSYVTGVAITPDGRRAVSASWVRTLLVWDLEGGDWSKDLKSARHQRNCIGFAACSSQPLVLMRPK
jgi:NB-ARC domain-containing protein/WD40 domain-containing protein/apoptotic protease-activating factor 1-like protein